jgi:hypothetical protein
MTSNPWLVTTPRPAPATRPSGTNDSIEPTTTDPTTDVGASGQLYWVGAHGGAGTTTLAAAAAVGTDAGRAWPPAPTTSPTAAPTAAPTTTGVLVVARTHARGLKAAREALRAHTGRTGGGGEAPLRGLVLVADAPGRLPRELRQQVRVLSGATPRLWEVPWVEAWRADPTAPPGRRITHLLSEMTTLR